MFRPEKRAGGYFPVRRTYKSTVQNRRHGSTDSSGDICDRFAQKDNRILVIHQGNAGVSAARNAGIEKACGDIIAFVDSDDILPENAYSILMSAWTDGTELVMGQIRYMSEDGEDINRDMKRLPNQLDLDTFVEDLFEEKQFPYLGFPWDKLYLRKIIAENNIRFNSSIKLNEDRLFILQYLMSCKAISCCNDIVYTYRQRGSDVINETGRRIVVTEAELTVLPAFEQMKEICKSFSDKMYYLCSRKSFESALDLLSRVPATDRDKRERLKAFMWENAKICLKNPQSGITDKAKVIVHCILKK